MKKITKILIFFCSALLLFPTIAMMSGGDYENLSGIAVLFGGYYLILYLGLLGVFLFFVYLFKTLKQKKTKELSAVQILFFILGIILSVFILYFILTNVIIPITMSSINEKNKESQKKESFTILIKALKDYSKENNGSYPIESSSCMIGRDCFNLTKLLSPYLDNFSIDQDLGIYYQSFNGSDCTLQNANGLLKYGYSCELDRIVNDEYLFRGRHTKSECFAISGASSVIGNPFGVCNLSKGLVFPKGWTDSQFYSKFSPEGY